MLPRRSPYERASQPQPIRLTTRDVHILETIYAFDGLLSLKQIDRLFFSGHGRSQPRARMRALFDNGFVNMPQPQRLHQIPRGETVYWLDRKGAEVVASLTGETLAHFKWRKQPRYSLISHDLATNDFRIATIIECAQANHYQLTQWISEGTLAAQPDRIEYRLPNGKSQSRLMRPDGMFVIQAEVAPHPFAFLLEIDMGTEDNPRFVREKVLPGMAYLKSDAYYQRFGLHYGRYLIVTTGERRLQNMKRQTERAGGQGLFYFTTYTATESETILTQPIWWQAGSDTRHQILPDTDRFR